MKLRYSLLILATTLVSGLLMAAEWWDKKPYTEWSERDVNRMLNDSPWVKLSLKDRRWNYRITFLSSEAVRGALLRRFAFSGKRSINLHAGQSVSIAELRRESDGDAERIRMERFIAEHPKDIRVTGDRYHIVISISMTSRSLRWFGHWRWQEDMRPSELVQLQLDDLIAKTRLSTKTGKTIPLADYEPPGMDRLGARFYFPRLTSDGDPAVTVDDQELLFETEVDGKEINVKFDLKKMLFKGKLEI